MGQHTRVGNILPKTEVKKAMKKKPIWHKASLETDEYIIHKLVESKKVYIGLILLSIL